MFERSNSVANVMSYMDTEIDNGALAACTLPMIFQELPVFAGFSTIDPDISAAAKTAIENEDFMPLIKEELKNRIQFKRMTEGKEELMIDFTEKPKSELTDTEKEKVERRRVQNRMAARRFRDKQKTMEAKLQKKTQNLESENTSLRTQIRELRKELENLQRLLQIHLSVCPNVLMIGS